MEARGSFPAEFDVDVIAPPPIEAMDRLHLLFVRTNDDGLQQARTKGAPSLSFHIKRGDKVMQGASGEIVHPGDVLRFSYTTERPVYFALLNVDGLTATVFHPLTATAVLIEPGRDAALGFCCRKTLLCPSLAR